MTKFACSTLLLALMTTVAGAQSRGPTVNIPTAPVLLVHHETDATAQPAEILTSLPADIWTVTDWYKQNVYDLSDNKIGEVMDVMLDHDGKTAAIIVGVGGFLGIGEKDVAVAFNTVHFKKKDNKWTLVMNTTKDALKSAPGFRYDRTAMMWTPESAPATIGGAKRAGDR